MKPNTHKIAISLFSLIILFTGFGLPVFAFAKNNVVQEKQCIQNAIGKRDDSLLTVIDQRYEDQKTALKNRKTNLSAAWNIGNQKNRRTAIKNAWQNYTNALQKSRKAYDATRLNAWKQFYANRKACGKNVISDDRTTEGVDNNL
ncbi:MAG: hypothetical protein US74_C0019G0010 [Parcubacteria group bacterium GW2011_GWA2_38_13]|nr:MAG: hypothetical protein US74_C0019G0010 [Parcubacteria group bacterium GW2011_GWA2_38_13]